MGVLIGLSWGSPNPAWASAVVGLTPPPSPLYKEVAPSSERIGKINMGREIAGVMGHEGANWLERPSRELQERPQMA
ncbi:MAG: hypothetical protein ACFB0C_11415, partial [Leptolyngbyaceae cyanobacterium]